MYKGGKPPVNYPNPTKLRWARPVYKLTSSKKKPKGNDEEDDEEEDDDDDDDDEFIGWLQMEDEDGNDYYVALPSKVRREDPEEPEDFWIWDEEERHYLNMGDDDEMLVMDENFEFVEEDEEEE